jgi:hypothetical protein
MAPMCSARSAGSSSKCRMTSKVLYFDRLTCQMCKRPVDAPEQLLECLPCGSVHCQECRLPACTDDPFRADSHWACTET